MSINLLRHAKSAICVMSIIIDAPAIAYTMVSNCRCCTPRQIDLTNICVTMQLPYCVSLLVLTSG